MIPTLLVGSAYAQLGNDIPIEFSSAEGVIVLVGGLAGLTTAYLGYRKVKSSEPNAKFNITRFLDRVIVAVITSIGLAIASSTGLLELNLFTLYLIFVSALGTAELVMEIRNRNGN